MFVLATPGSGYLTSIEPGKKLCQGGAFQEASRPIALLSPSLGAKKANPASKS